MCATYVAVYLYMYVQCVRCTYIHVHLHVVVDAKLNSIAAGANHYTLNWFNVIERFSKVKRTL